MQYSLLMIVHLTFFCVSPALDHLVLAFCLSILVGLVLGALVYILLTWASRRRRASAVITRRSKKQSARSQGSGGGQLGLYRSTFLSVHRQPSVEPVGPLGSKPGAEASTFRPLARGGGARPEKEGPDALFSMPQDTASSSDSSASDSTALVPGKRNSFWLGGNGLKGFLPTQPNQPLAYNGAIHAFQETRT